MQISSVLFCLALAVSPLLDPPPPVVKPRVRLDTSYGAIILELDPVAAPKTVENFLEYVKAGHYTNTIFHRVVPAFMIQGGGFTEDLREKPTKPPIVNEAGLSSKAGFRNTMGTIAMARTQNPDSATSQFFINTADNPKLDHQDSTPDGQGYCVFGRVVEGMDAVTKIEKVLTVTRKGMFNVPEYTVRITSAEVLTMPSK